MGDGRGKEDGKKRGPPFIEKHPVSLFFLPN
jgi:hypothetical protein